MPALAKAGRGIGERFEQNGTRHPASRTSPSRQLFAVSRHRWCVQECASIAESGEWECLDERDFGATRLGNFCRCKGRQPMIPSSSS